MAFSRQAALKAWWLALILFWSCRGDSNSRPAAYKAAALPTELRQHLISQQILASGTPCPGTITLHCSTWLPDMPCPVMRRTWGMLSPRSLSRLLQGLYYFFCALLFCIPPCFSPTPYWSELSSVWKLYIYTNLESRLFFRYPLKILWSTQLGPSSRHPRPARPGGYWHPRSGPRHIE